MSTILVINPNSDASVTENLKHIMDPAPDTTYKFFTAPSGPSEIDSYNKEIESASICLKELLPVMDQYDAFLVACFSEHPLIKLLKEHTSKPVLGIFQASVLHAMAFGGGKFAIITTSKSWEAPLDKAVLSFLGSHSNFAGTFPTGMHIPDLQSLPKEEIGKNYAAAVQKAVDRGAVNFILGCAGMTGMEEYIKAVAGPKARVIDGVISGAEMLVGMLRAVN
ncbi:hypothetical protein TRVA0_016S02432 [Trichomonascus vanleenenianus]|uniref:Dcg1p n=1 Tax=Trichomonascus vanleenenianus TaxID=2268995 RepID=UPI003ECA45AC